MKGLKKAIVNQWVTWRFPNLSRPFTVAGVTYVVDLETGRKYLYDWQSMRITGRAA